MLKLIFVLLFLRVTCAIVVKEDPRYSNKFKVQDVSSCGEATRLVFSITKNFFEDQFSLTVIDFFSYQAPTANALKCVVNNNYRPVALYNDLQHVKFPPRVGKSAVSAYPITEGFVLKAPFEEIFDLIKSVAFHNPQSKLLILQIGRNDTKAQEILKKAFHVHKMLKVAVLNIETKIIEDNPSTTVSVMMYNPFKPTDNFVVFDTKVSSGEMLGDAMRSFMEQRTRNLHGFKLSISMFEYPMTSRVHYDDQGNVSHYSLADGDMVNTFSKLMNFTMTYDDPTSGFGFQFPNGTFVGSLAEVEEGRADLAGNPKFIADYNTSNSLFLQSIASSQLSFIIRKRETRKVFAFLMFGIFDKPTAIIVFFLTGLFPLVYVIVNRLEQKLFNGKTIDSFGKCVLNVFAIMNNISIKQSPHQGTRIVITTLLFNTLIMTTLFQSTIVKNLNVNLEVGKITSLQQLVDEGYKVRMNGFVALIFREPGLDKVSWVLNKTKQTYLDVHMFGKNLSTLLLPNEKTAFLWAELFTKNYLNQYFDEESGENLFESIPEIAYEFFVSQMVPKNSPFIEDFNEILLRYVEAGIGSLHISQAFSENDRVWIKRVKEGKIPKVKSGAIRINDLVNVFKIHLSLCGLSCAVFFMEIFIKIFGKKIKRP